MIRDEVSNALTSSLGSDTGAIGGVSLHSGSIIVVVCYRAESNVSEDAVRAVADSINGGGSVSVSVNGTTLTSTGAAAISECSADPTVATGAPTAAPTNAPTTQSPTTAPTATIAASNNADSSKTLGGAGGVVGITLLVVVIVALVVVVLVKKSSKSDKSDKSDTDSYMYDEETPPTIAKDNIYDTASPEPTTGKDDGKDNATPDGQTRVPGWKSPLDGHWDDSDMIPAARTLQYELADAEVDADAPPSSEV